MHEDCFQTLGMFVEHRSTKGHVVDSVTCVMLFLFLEGPMRGLYWVAVNELKLSYYSGKPD